MYLSNRLISSLNKIFQRKRQKVNTSIEKDFYKLMNNENFGYDCRDNANNAKFQPVIDKVNKIKKIL